MKSLKGYKTYLLVVVIVVLAAAQKYLGLHVDESVYATLFALAIAAARSGMGGKSALFLFLISGLCFCCGCAVSDKQTSALVSLGKEYYAAPNCAELLHVVAPEGKGSVTFSGFSELTLNCPVPPKNIVPQNPSVIDSAGGLLEKVAPWAFLGWGVQKGALK